MCGIYFQRLAPYRALICSIREDGGAFQWIVKWPENVLAPIDGCGFGCVLTSIKMLRKMETPWFEWKKFSEDFTFCVNARKSGFQLYCDTSVLCGHLQDPKPATFDDFKEANKDIYMEVNEDGAIRPGSAA